MGFILLQKYLFPQKQPTERLESFAKLTKSAYLCSSESTARLLEASMDCYVEPQPNHSGSIKTYNFYELRIANKRRGR